MSWVTASFSRRSLSDGDGAQLVAYIRGCRIWERKKKKKKKYPRNRPFEMLRIPHGLDNRLTDDGKVVSPAHRLRSTPKTIIFLLLVLISATG
jgi:hypothetical protein